MRRVTHAVGDLQARDIRPVVLRDVREATKAQKASVHPDEITRYIEYDRKHGAQRAPPKGEGGEDDDDEW